MYYDLRQQVEYHGRWFFGHLALRSGERVDSRIFCQSHELRRNEEIVLSVFRPGKCLSPSCEKQVVTRKLAETSNPEDVEL